MSLKSELNRALRNGGAGMSPARRAKVFTGVSPRRAHQVLWASTSPDMIAAIRSETVGDARVIPVLLAQGERVSRLILQLEMKLGRKLSRARATALVCSYKAVLAAKARPLAQVIPLWLVKSAHEAAQRSKHAVNCSNTLRRAYA